MPFMKMEMTEHGLVPTGIISDSKPELAGEIWLNFVETNEPYDPTFQTRTYIVAGPSIVEKIVTDEAKVYLAERRARYPSIEDQLDTIYHKGVAGWKTEIAKIKNDCPKSTVEESPES